MTPWACTEVRRHLEAFHDGELAIDDQVSVEQHLDWCDECAAACEDLRALQLILVAGARNQQAFSQDEQAVFQAGVMSRVKAEEGASFGRSLHIMFEDMRLVYAGMGATTAALACVLMLLGMMRFAAAEQRPDSLAAVVNAMAAKGAAAAAASPMPVMPVVVEARLLASNGVGPIVAADSEMMGDAEYVVRFVLTREGRATNVELQNMRSGEIIAPGTEVGRFFRPLIGAVSRARFEPATVDGLPVVRNMAWMVPHTTVRPAKAPEQVIAKAPLKKHADIPDVEIPVRLRA
jgi:hypothetical protein